MSNPKRTCRRVIGVALAAALLAGVPAQGPGVPAPEAHTAPDLEAGCKPRAPLATELSARSAADGTTELSWELRPLRDFELAGWELRLSPGVTLAEGGLAGPADARRGAATRAGARLQLPAAGQPAEATLVAWGHWPADPASGASAERVEVRRRLRWGPEPRAGDATVLAAPGSSHEKHLAVLGAAHRTGR